MKRILFIIILIFSFISFFGQQKVDTNNIEITQHQNEGIDSTKDSSFETQNFVDESKIYNQKVLIAEDSNNEKKSNTLDFRFILSGILIMLASIVMFLRLWTFKNAQRIEDGKLQYNLPELFDEYIFSFDFLWIIPVQNNYKNEKAKKMDSFSKIMLYSLYASIILIIINLITL